MKKDEEQNIGQLKKYISLLNFLIGKINEIYKYTYTYIDKDRINIRFYNTSIFPTLSTKTRSLQPVRVLRTHRWRLQYMEYLKYTRFVWFLNVLVSN